MSFEIYHQLGHNYDWNISGIRDDKSIGDGIIVGPRYMKRMAVEQLTLATARKAIFDPQFFLPAIQRGMLSTYDFFPNVVAEGFDTSEYPGSMAEESARKCVSFQVRNEFRYVVIPTRVLTGTPSNFVDLQEGSFVLPFLEEIRSHSSHKPVILQLVLNDDMLKDDDFRNDILNWVTGISDINGVYLIVQRAQRTKQVKDIDLLSAMMNFIHILKQNDLVVVLGYLNTEALLLSLASPDIITIGSYENTRIFNLSSFQDQEKKKIHGPTPRIYIPKLIQLVNHNYINPIRKSLLSEADLLEDNEYKAIMFKPTYQWHFSKPELYMDYFTVFSKQLRGISALNGADRYNAVCDIMREAKRLYARLKDAGVELDPDSDDSHIPLWLTVANQFANEQGWR